MTFVAGNISIASIISPSSRKFLTNADSLNKLKVPFLRSVTLRVPAQQTSRLLACGSVQCFLSEKHWRALRRMRRFHWLPFFDKKNPTNYFRYKSFHSAHWVPESESHALIIFALQLKCKLGLTVDNEVSNWFNCIKWRLKTKPMRWLAKRSLKTNLC